MSLPILTVTIRHEHDTVAARQRARQIARLAGFDTGDQTRISTAVSEIARNAFNYARGGKVEYSIEGKTAPQLLMIRVTDNGPGIRNLTEILEGRYQSPTGMGLGISGARRLMDQFEIRSEPGKGTTILMKKLLPARAPVIQEAGLKRIADDLAFERPDDPFQELQHQNRELLRVLDDLRGRQEDLTRLNRELEDTNRGVVALYAELDEKADHLRRADDLKSKFLSNMSHEFRSPLNSILALSGLLIKRTDGDLSGEQEQQIGFIRKAAQDLLELVNDLLDLAKVEAGKIEIKPIEFEVENLFAALRGMLRPLLLNQSIDLVFESAAEIPPLWSDEGKVSQILRNFISNSLKFTERGEVRISAELAGAGEVRFCVSDTGIGIAPEHIDLIFQDFVQLDSPLQRRVKGTGLGLPLSRKLATLLGGSVGVKSQPGEGSTFTLRIPMRYADPAAEEQRPLTQWSKDTAGVPVLFVEDRPEIILTYGRYLKDTGFGMLAASTVRDARDILERAESPAVPRVIVLDILLRSEDTWKFMAELKANPRTAAIPVMVVSTVEDQAKAFHLGAAAYLLKPVHPAELLSHLRRLARGAQKLALIVDDNELDRYVLRQELRDSPFAVIESSSGPEGLRIAAEASPDAIFLDLTMPNMSGVEVLEKLKASPQLRTIPVIIVTSRVLTDLERRRLMEHAAAVVGKGDFGGPGLERLLQEVAGTTANNERG